MEPGSVPPGNGPSERLGLFRSMSSRMLDKDIPTQRTSLNFPQALANFNLISFPSTRETPGSVPEYVEPHARQEHTQLKEHPYTFLLLRQIQSTLIDKASAYNKVGWRKIQV